MTKIMNKFNVAKYNEKINTLNKITAVQRKYLRHDLN